VTKGHLLASTVAIKGSLLMNRTTQDVIKSGKTSSKPGYVNWNLPGNFHLLKQTVIGHIAAKDAKDTDDDLTEIVPARDAINPHTYNNTAQWHVDHLKTWQKPSTTPVDKQNALPLMS